MVVWSSLPRLFSNSAVLNHLRYSPKFKDFQKNGIKIRNMSGDHHFAIQPSRFQWQKFKTLVHFYTMLGLIPVMAVVFYCNVFIGPAQLTEIPEGYVPKHWEYHRHPITRFLARMYPSPQQEYEKLLHYMDEEYEKKELRELEAAVRRKISERNDYQAYYYQPAMAKYYRISKEAWDYLAEIRGE